MANSSRAQRHSNWVAIDGSRIRIHSAAGRRIARRHRDQQRDCPDRPHRDRDLEERFRVWACSDQSVPALATTQIVEDRHDRWRAATALARRRADVGELGDCRDLRVALRDSPHSRHGAGTSYAPLSGAMHGLSRQRGGVLNLAVQRTPEAWPRRSGPRGHEGLQLGGCPFRSRPMTARGAVAEPLRFGGHPAQGPGEEQ